MLSRILFLFAKLNPGIRYVQGMNELLAPIYYVFARETDPQQNSKQCTALHCNATPALSPLCVLVLAADRLLYVM